MFRMGFGFPAFIALAMLLRFAIIASLVVFIGRRFKKHGRCRNNALIILDNKFASGELTEEEYLKKKNILN